MYRLHTTVTASNAAEQAPQLRQLLALSAQSNHRLALIRSLLPPTLRNSVRAGPVQDTEWCLLVANASVAAKLRQLTPMLLAHLRTKGESVQTLRIKVSTQI
ncbi:hypothetical protein CCO03_15825 [Comamonas serinivorans]|uniref:DUF721 domain-containing protein n=1 Tax=Comamonas serinivorans TaxID=1082851 RepID=A0A1Y0EQR7_9BURK|nr:DciA family protein [Comamonas serinivorans]ARU05943.1 hypothetical protein CCO03_15825 [Comamonas serinivorans]